MDVDVVQRQKTSRLTERERAVVSAFGNDLLKWCTDDVLRSMKDDWRSADEKSDK